MKTNLTPEQLEKKAKSNKKIFLFIFISAIVLWIIVLIVPKDKDNTTTNQKTINIDSLMLVIKKDNLYEIKDIYYNIKDSSLSIAFTNKDNTITDKNYSTFYFNKTYHLDSLANIEGVYLYAYKYGNSFVKGDYKKPLTYGSRKLGRITAAFDSKYYSEYLKTYKPLYDYLQDNVNDPSSIEIIQSWNLGMNKDNAFEVKTTFRAKNAFGTLMIHTVNCDIDNQGNVMNVAFDK